MKVILYPWLYDAAKAAGYDMTEFIRQERIPMIGDDYAQGQDTGKAESESLNAQVESDG